MERCLQRTVVPTSVRPSVHAGAVKRFAGKRLRLEAEFLAHAHAAKLSLPFSEIINQKPTSYNNIDD